MGFQGGEGSASSITRKKYSYNGLTINDVTTDVDNYYLLDFVDIDDVQVRNIEEEKSLDDGIQDYDSYLGRRIFRVTGKITGSTQAILEDMIQDLKDTFNPRLLQVNNPTTDGYLPLTWLENFGGVSYTMRLELKPMSIPAIQYDFDVGGLVAPFEIILKARDPRKTDSDVISANLTVSNSADTVTNAGTYMAWPEFTITGPIYESSMTISNDTTGEYLSLSGAISLSSTEELTINMKDRRIYTGTNVNDYYQYVTSGSTFPWDINSGSAQISITGHQLSAGTAKYSLRSTWI